MFNFRPNQPIDAFFKRVSNTSNNTTFVFNNSNKSSHVNNTSFKVNQTKTNTTTNTNTFRCNNIKKNASPCTSPSRLGQVLGSFYLLRRRRKWRAAAVKLRALTQHEVRTLHDLS